MCLGIPGRVVAVLDATRRLGQVDLDGQLETVNLGPVCGGVEPAELVGSWVVVHLGFAQQRVDEAEAKLILDVLRDLAAARDELLRARPDAPRRA